MTPAALAANRRNALAIGSGRPKGEMYAERMSFKEACCKNDLQYVEVLNNIALHSTNEGFQMTAIRDLFDRGHGRPTQAIEGTGVGGAIAFQVVLPAALADDSSDDSSGCS